MRAAVFAWHLPLPHPGQGGTFGGHRGGTPSSEQHFLAEESLLCASGCTGLRHGYGPATT